MLTDSLPGLPNRAGFSDRLESRIEAGRVASCAVLVVDLDRFSRVNACLGALAGDELLITVARRIKGALRVRATLARIGGDEFGILMAIAETSSAARRVGKECVRTVSSRWSPSPSQTPTHPPPPPPPHPP